MAAEIGRRTQCAIGREETTYGTLSAALLGLPFTSIAVAETKNTVMNNQAYGRIEENTEGSKIGSKMAQITLGGILPVVAVGHLLKAVFRDMATVNDSPVASADTHTFTLDNDSNAHPSYSIVYKDGIQQRAVLGALLNTLTINIVAGEWVTYEAVFIGRFPVANTSDITYTDEEKWTASMAQMKMGATIAGLGSAMTISEATIVFEKNANPYYAWGSQDVNKVVNHQFSVRVDTTNLWEGTTERTLFTDHTVQALQIKLTTTAFVTGTTPYDLTINLRNGKVTEHNIGRGLDETMEQTFTFLAEYDISETSEADAVLINGTNGSVYGVT